MVLEVSQKIETSATAHLLKPRGMFGLASLEWLFKLTCITFCVFIGAKGVA